MHARAAHLDMVDILHDFLNPALYQQEGAHPMRLPVSTRGFMPIADARLRL